MIPRTRDTTRFLDQLDTLITQQEAANTATQERVQHSGLRSRVEKALALQRETEQRNKGPFANLQLLRDALEKLNKRGWKRSYHQRLFHEDFLKACIRIFWKGEKDGQFQIDHQKILQMNAWEHLPQEVLISTPRRFGKTIGVSMFAAAMLYACPGVELSIYSTCKRISQKLLRNVVKFFMIMIDNNHKEFGFKVIRQNMEEITLQGCNGESDQRTVNSYPSKVTSCPCMHACLCSTVLRCRQPRVQVTPQCTNQKSTSNAKSRLS